MIAWLKKAHRWFVHFFLPKILASFLLTVVYFLVLAPTVIIFKLFYRKRFPESQQLSESSETYWRPLKLNNQDINKQF